MPGPLQNHRHEIFCREYAAGETLAAAYVRAGFKDSLNARYNGSRLRNTPACRARIDELMREFADAAKVKVEFLQERLLPILEASAQDLFDEAGNLKPVATLQRDCAAAIKSIKFDRKTGKVSEVVLADKVGVAGLLLRSIGAVKDGEGTADSIDRLGQRLDRAIGRLSCDDQRLLADAIGALESDGPASALERGGEDEGR